MSATATNLRSVKQQIDDDIVTFKKAASTASHATERLYLQENAHIINKATQICDNNLLLDEKQNLAFEAEINKIVIKTLYQQLQICDDENARTSIVNRLKSLLNISDSQWLSAQKSMSIFGRPKSEKLIEAKLIENDLIIPNYNPRRAFIAEALQKILEHYKLLINSKAFNLHDELDSSKRNEYLAQCRSVIFALNAEQEDFSRITITDPILKSWVDALHENLNSSKELQLEQLENLVKHEYEMNKANFEAAQRRYAALAAESGQRIILNKVEHSEQLQRQTIISQAKVMLNTLKRLRVEPNQQKIKEGLDWLDTKVKHPKLSKYLNRARIPSTDLTLYNRVRYTLWKIIEKPYKASFWDSFKSDPKVCLKTYDIALMLNRLGGREFMQRKFDKYFRHEAPQSPRKQLEKFLAFLEKEFQQIEWLDFEKYGYHEITPERKYSSILPEFKKNINRWSDEYDCSTRISDVKETDKLYRISNALIELMEPHISEADGELNKNYVQLKAQLYAISQPDADNYTVPTKKHLKSLEKIRTELMNIYKGTIQQRWMLHKVNEQLNFLRSRMGAGTTADALLDPLNTKLREIAKSGNIDIEELKQISEDLVDYYHRYVHPYDLCVQINSLLKRYSFTRSKYQTDIVAKVNAKIKNLLDNPGNATEEDLPVLKEGLNEVLKLYKLNKINKIPLSNERAIEFCDAMLASLPVVITPEKDYKLRNRFEQIKQIEDPDLKQKRLSEFRIKLAIAHKHTRMKSLEKLANNAKYKLSGLETLRYAITDRKHVSNDKQFKRSEKKFFNVFSDIFTFILAGGQAFLSFYALWSLIPVIGPVFAPILAVAASFSTLYTNFVLFRQETRDLAKQAFITKDYFNGFTSISGKLLMGTAFVFSFGMAATMAVLVYVAVMTNPMFPFFWLAAPIAMSLFVTSLTGFTALMYVTTANILKGMCNTLQKWCPEIEKAGWGLTGLVKGVGLAIRKQWRIYSEIGFGKSLGSGLKKLLANLLIGESDFELWRNPVRIMDPSGENPLGIPKPGATRLEIRNKRIELLASSLISKLFFGVGKSMLIISSAAMLVAWNAETFAGLTTYFGLPAAVSKPLSFVFVWVISGTVNTLFNIRAFSLFFTKFGEFVAKSIIAPPIQTVFHAVLQPIDFTMSCAKSIANAARSVATFCRNTVDNPWKSVYHVKTKIMQLVVGGGTVILNAVGAAALVLKDNMSNLGFKTYNKTLAAFFASESCNKNAMDAQHDSLPPVDIPLEKIKAKLKLTKYWDAEKQRYSGKGKQAAKAKAAAPINFGKLHGMSSSTDYTEAGVERFAPMARVDTNPFYVANPSEADSTSDPLLTGEVPSKVIAVNS